MPVYNRPYKNITIDEEPLQWFISRGKSPLSTDNTFVTIDQFEMLLELVVYRCQDIVGIDYLPKDAEVIFSILDKLPPNRLSIAINCMDGLISKLDTNRAYTWLLMFMNSKDKVNQNDAGFSAGFLTYIILKNFKTHNINIEDDLIFNILKTIFVDSMKIFPSYTVTNSSFIQLNKDMHDHPPTIKAVNKLKLLYPHLSST